MVTLVVDSIGSVGDEIKPPLDRDNYCIGLHKRRYLTARMSQLVVKAQTAMSVTTGAASMSIDSFA